MFQQQIEEMKRAIEEKRCPVCKNTYTVNDQITFCCFSHDCVDENNGQQCEHWDPLEVI